MPNNVFVSHVYEDLGARRAIGSWASQGLLGSGVVIIGESEDVRLHGERAVRNHLHPKLTEAGSLIVLVGNDTHNHRWIEYEAQHALSARKRVVPVRITGTTGAAPAILAGLAFVQMTPAAIRAALGT